MVLVLLDDALRVVIGVERVHEDKGNVDFVDRVQVLDLANREIKERHPLPNFDRGFRCTTPE